jgi:hypothetical protein
MSFNPWHDRDAISLTSGFYQLNQDWATLPPAEYQPGPAQISNTFLKADTRLRFCFFQQAIVDNILRDLRINPSVR